MPSHSSTHVLAIFVYFKGLAWERLQSIILTRHLQITIPSGIISDAPCAGC